MRLKAKPLVLAFVILCVLLIFILKRKKDESPSRIRESTVISPSSHPPKPISLKEEKPKEFEGDFRMRLMEQLPLETQFEKEYFGKGVVLSNLHPYSVVNNSIAFDLSRFNYEAQNPMQLSPTQLSSYFFSETFVGMAVTGKMIDHRLDKTLYVFKNTLETKVSGLKVHALFNHELEYRDDFLEYPWTTDRSKHEYCNSEDLCSGPNSNNLCSMCENTKPKFDNSLFYREWCSKPNIDLAIISIVDGILDYGTTHPEARFNIYDRFGNIFTLSAHNMKFHKGANWGIEYVPLLASIGTTYYPGAFGHFPIEILPRILFLHRFIPLHIPIVIYEHQFVRDIVNELFKLNIMQKERKIIWAKPNTYYVASRLYFIHSKSDIATPLTPDIILRMSSWMMKQPYLNGIVENPYKDMEPYILIVDRSDSGSRMIDNNGDMVKAVEIAASKKGIKVLNLKLSTLKSFFVIGQVFYGSVGIIAPHGAGLANINVSRKSIKFIIEIGWKGFPGRFAWPGDYYCQARALGLKYYAVTSTYGHYYTKSMGVNVEEIVSIVEKEINQ